MPLRTEIKFGLLTAFPTVDDVDELADFLQSRQPVGLWIPSDWASSDLPDVEYAPALVRLDVWSILDGKTRLLERAPNLEKINLHHIVRSRIDLTAATGLRDLFCNWSPKLASLLECRGLSKLRVHGYPGTDIKAFSKLENMGNLWLIQGRLRSTEGLDAMKNLWALSLGHQRQLTAENVRIPSTVQVLNIIACRKFGNVDFLANLPDLRWCMLEKMGKIESLHPIRACKKLAHLYFDEVSIKDGDVRFLLDDLNIQRIGFQNRRHYNANRQKDFPDLFKSSPLMWQDLMESPFTT